VLGAKLKGPASEGKWDLKEKEMGDKGAEALAHLLGGFTTLRELRCTGRPGAGVSWRAPAMAVYQLSRANVQHNPWMLMMFRVQSPECSAGPSEARSLF
jgi:hypothetical protein